MIMILTLMKPDGPGWLMILEAVIDGKYKILEERLPKEPQYDLIMVVIERLTRRLDQIEGVEIGVAKEPKPRSFKRAAREASKEMARRKESGGIPKCMLIKSEEYEKAKTMVRQTLELLLWVKPGKKQIRLMDERFKGMNIVEVPSSIQDKRTNEYIRQELKRQYQLFDSDIELVEGFSSQIKRFRLTLRKHVDV